MWEMSKGKGTYKYAWMLIFWKSFESTEFSCILLLIFCGWDLHGLQVFNKPLAKILAKFTRPVLRCATVVQKITQI